MKYHSKREIVRNHIKKVILQGGTIDLDYFLAKVSLDFDTSKGLIMSVLKDYETIGVIEINVEKNKLILPPTEKEVDKLLEDSKNASNIL